MSLKAHILSRYEIIKFVERRCEMIRKDEIEKYYVSAPEAAGMLNVSRSGLL